MTSIPTPEQKVQVKTIMAECQEKLQQAIGKPVNVIYRIKVNHINPQLIINLVCHVQKITYSQVLSKSQEKPMVAARHMIMWLVRWYCGFIDTQIAELVNRERSTVTHALKLVDDMLEIADPLYIGPIQEVEKLILNVTNIDTP